MSDPKPVLSEEQAAGLCPHCEGRGDTRYCKHNDVRAVERAVLEALPDAAAEAQANADLCARLMALEGDNEALRARVAELERDVEEGSNEIGEVMQVNERLAKERDAARRELEAWTKGAFDVAGDRNAMKRLLERIIGIEWHAREGRITASGEIPCDLLDDMRAALDRAREGE